MTDVFCLNDISPMTEIMAYTNDRYMPCDKSKDIIRLFPIIKTNADGRSVDNMLAHWYHASWSIHVLILPVADYIILWHALEGIQAGKMAKSPYFGVMHYCRPMSWNRHEKCGCWSDVSDLLKQEFCAWLTTVSKKNDAVYPYYFWKAFQGVCT